MSVYPPPTNEEPLSIFNTLNYIFPTDAITREFADKNYLKFPIAQGTENLFDTNVTGTLDVTGNIVINTVGNGLTFPDNTKQTTASNFVPLVPSPAGNYTYSTIAVNSFGQVTSASSGATPVSANNNVYNYPQIWRNSTLYSLGSAVPLPAVNKTASVLIPVPASGGLTATPNGMSITLEISYMLIEQTSYSAIATRVLANWYSVVLINVSPLQKAINGTDVITFVKLVDTTSTGTSAWSPQSINYTAQPPSGGGYNTGSFTPLTYQYLNGASPHPTLNIIFGGFTSPFLNASAAGGATNYQPLLGLQRSVRIIDSPVSRDLGFTSDTQTGNQTFPNTSTQIYQAYFAPVSISG
jgi:hypothetical protein